MSTFKDNSGYYIASAFIFGTVGAIIGISIAQDLGEVVYNDTPTSDNGHFAVYEGDGSDEAGVDYYTKAGKQWIGGSTGVGAFFGLLLVLICSEDNRNSVKNMFTSMFYSKPASTNNVLPSTSHTYQAAYQAL